MDELPRRRLAVFATVLVLGEVVIADWAAVEQRRVRGYSVGQQSFVQNSGEAGSTTLGGTTPNTCMHTARL